MIEISVLNTRLYRKDLPGNLGADVTLTNNGATEFVTELGTTIAPGQSKVITDFEYRTLADKPHTGTGLRTRAQVAAANNITVVAVV